METPFSMLAAPFRTGKCVQSELYEDGSCATYDMDGVLTLPALMEKRVKAG